MNELGVSVRSDAMSVAYIICLALIMIIGLMILNAVYSGLASVEKGHGSSIITSYYTKMKNSLITIFIIILIVLGASIPVTLFVALKMMTQLSLFV